MKKIILMAALAVSSAAFAADVNLGRVTLGSGQPGAQGVENAIVVDSADGILHAPQYMVGYPTAATIWPRVIEVPCVKAGVSLKCDGYKWLPSMGRGEYLFIQPRVVEPQPPIVVVEKVPVEKIIIKEVPMKKVGE